MLALKRKHVLIGLGTILVLAAGAAAAWWLWLRPAAPDPATASPLEIARYMASDQFAGLSDKDRGDYLEQARAAQPDRRAASQAASELTEAERERLFRNMGQAFRQRMDRQMDEYFKMPPDQRTAYLDGILDRMQQRQSRSRPGGVSAGGAAPGATASGGNAQPHGRGRGFSPERMRRMIENTDPQRRAMHAEFRKQLRQRASQRGIPMRG